MTKKKAKGVNPWLFPDADREQLARDLVTASRDLAVHMRSHLGSMKFDASEKEIAESESELMKIAKKLFAPIIAALPAIAESVYRFSRKQFAKVDKRAGGMAFIAIEKKPNMIESWAKEPMKNWVGVAKASIEKLYTDQVNDWTSTVRLQNLRGASKKEVNKAITQRYAIYRSWSINRSEGMIGSWNSKLMRMNLEAAGVTRYTWHGWLDDRERLSHVVLEGKVIDINDAHIFPGEEYGCRCWAVPYYGKES